MVSPILSHASIYDATNPRYYPLNAWFFTTANATEVNMSQPMPVSGILQNLYIDQKATAPGTGKSVTYTVYKNGIATSLSCTVSDTNTTASDTNASHVVVYAPGDTLSLQATPNGTPATSDFLFSAEQVQVGQSVLTGSADTSSSTASAYASLQAGGWITSTPSCGTILPTSGIFKNLQIALSVAPGVGKSYTYTLVKNGVDSSIVVTISDNATTGNDSAHSLAVAAGDELYWRCDPSGTPTNTRPHVGIQFLPNVDGESIQTYASIVSNVSPTGTAQFVGVGGSGGGGGYATVELNRINIIAGVYTVKNLYAKVSTAPGLAASGKKDTFAVRQNLADTTVTLDIVETATTGNDTSHNFTTAAGDRIGIKVVGTNSPAATPNGWGFVTYQAPPYKPTATMF